MTEKTMLPCQIKEYVVFGALIVFLMASFQDHLIAIGGLSLVAVLALDDLSRAAFRQAMMDDTIKQTVDEPIVYIIEPGCRFKWLVWRQATIAAEWHRARGTRR